MSEDKYMIDNLSDELNKAFDSKKTDKLEDILGKLTDPSSEWDAEDTMLPSYKKLSKKRRGYTNDTALPSYSKTPEYMIISNFNKRDTASILANVGQLINNNNWELMDLDMVNSSFEEIILALRVVKRYRALSDKAQDILTYDREGFYVGDSIFHTLDEVEKALNNKAFL